MTRINCVPVTELSRLHLVAEYRELPRLFGMMKKYQSLNKTPADFKIPAEYKLGSGHMMFFINKGGWLLRRQHELIAEMLRRGYEPKFTDPGSLVRDLHKHWCGSWKPTPEAIRLNRKRIKERTNANS